MQMCSMQLINLEMVIVGKQIIQCSLKFLQNFNFITLWVSQSASNSHPKLKMSVDSESSHQNTSRQL